MTIFMTQNDSFEHNVSYWIHKTLSNTSKKSTDNGFTRGLTILWKTLAFLNHGPPWILGIISMFAISYVHDFYLDDDSVWKLLFWKLYVNRITALTITAFFLSDVCILGIMKAVFRKPRPVYFKDSALAKEGFITTGMDNIGPDKYSFPSGHCSRIVVFTVLAFYNFHGWAFVIPVLLLPLIVLMGVGRIAMAKHYLYDVLVGYVVGFIEGSLYQFLLSDVLPRLELF